MGYTISKGPLVVDAVGLIIDKSGSSRMATDAVRDLRHVQIRVVVSEGTCKGTDMLIGGEAVEP